MRRLTLSISEPLAGRQVRTLLRRELGLSAAGVRRAKDQPDGILLDGQPARVFGSQGQQRSCVLAMKLAEATVIGDLFGEHPVLLLDDVLSELDDERQTYLLTRMGEHQTIVTTCDTAAFARTNGKIVMVKGGVVEEA